MQIEYYIKQVYGNTHLYVLNPDFQKAMQLLTGQITLTKQAKNGFEMLGFTFVQVLPPVTTKKVEPTTSQFNS